jgi:predicted ArsR family transcriptional regulator
VKLADYIDRLRSFKTRPYRGGRPYSSARQIRILEILRRSPSTAVEIANEIGADTDRIRPTISRLKSRGLVVSHHHREYTGRKGAPARIWEISR